MPLERLLSVVVLSPAQAALVAAELLAAARGSGHRTGTVDGVGPAHDDAWAVAITPAGAVEVGRVPAGEGSGVTDLLEQLSRNSRRLPAHPRPDHLLLLRRVEDAAAASRLETGAGAGELEGALTEVLGPGARQRLSGQLAALVAAFARIAPSVAVPVAALATPGASAPGPHRATPSRSTPSRTARRGHVLTRPRARTRRRLLVALLVVAALALSGYVMLRSPGDGVTGALGRDKPSATRPGSGPGSSAGSGQQPRPGRRHHVQTLAPRHAGPVTGLAVRKAGSCTPGARCPVTVTVRVRPASTSRTVTWKVGAARWCGKGVTWSPPTTVTARPGWRKVFASSSVRVPRGRSLALVALTTTPARAQSAPVPAARSLLSCASPHAQR